MELFDMVKAAPPPQTISAPERKSTPSPIPPDSPDAIDAADDDGLLESVTINDDDIEDEHKKDNNKRKAGAGAGNEDTDDDDADDSSPFKIPTKSQMNSSLLKDKQEAASSSAKVQKKLKKYKQLNDAEKQEETPESSNKSAGFKMPKTPRKYKETEKPEASEEAKPHKKRATEELEDNGDSDGSLDGHPKAMPTKTKAQQKMFSDPQPDPPSGSERFLLVRIRRLTQSEIDAASASLSSSKFADSIATRKRGRPRKSTNEKKSPSPAKKLKPTPPKIHIKVPLQSGGKKRGLQQQLARNQTPPPPPPPPKSSMRKATVPRRSISMTLPPKGPKPSPDLVKRYGARYFNCLVRVRKTPWPSKSPERNPRSGFGGGVHKGRSRKGNLSVSFSEAVEILGSNDGGSRRSTFGPISSKSPKPTRLQRVDATGNVLEDIALTSNLLFSGNSAAASSSSGASGSRGKSKRRSCNGSPRLKRPHQRLPLSDLASLRLDDGPKSDDEEYIVPNELPGMQRPGTPTPKKKKISFTTTISDDDEDEKPATKKSKDANVQKRGPKPKPKPSPKAVEKSSSLKESILQKGKLQGKANEIAKEPLKKALVVLAEDQVASEKEVKTAAAETQNKKEERDEGGEEQDEPKPVDIAKDKPQDAGETMGAAAETDVGAGKNVSEVVEENAKEHAEEKSKVSVEESGEDLNESQEMSALEVTQTEPEDVKEQEEVKDVEEDFRELDTPTSQPLPPTTEENQDDVLEIQTSLEDVRQLHTPFLSQQSTPQQASKRIRLDSGDSECSFKSASEQHKEAMGRVNAEGGDEAAGEVAGEDKSPGALLPVSDIDSAAMPAVLITPPSVPRTVNGSEPTNGGSSINAACYSPIEAMPTLDDEVLEQLVEPDFQLNSSRHAISRGTLDDIMTALES